ncbi:MAG TPA: G5 domain-containing protein [Capillibacterium sp.]
MKTGNFKLTLPSHWGGYLVNTLGGLVFFLLLIYALQMKTITVAVDGARQQVKTTAATIEKALKQAGISVRPGDEVNPGLTERVREGMAVSIRRGVNFTILVDGQEVAVCMPPVPAKEALVRAGIELGEADRLSVPPETPIWEGLQLRVIRVTTGTITIEKEINPPVSYINDPNLDQGKQRVVNPGEKGILAQDYAVVYENGYEVSRTPLGERVVKPAVRKVIARGTRPLVYTKTVGRGQVIRYTKVLTMEATAYEPGPQSCGIYADGYTYTGKKATYGIAAVDPKVIPLGTKLYIEGYGFAAAEDIGSAIKGNRIDVCYDTLREALLWGRKKVKVYILAP